MNVSDDSERIERNVQHTTGMHALRQIRTLVNEVEEEDAAGAKLLRAFLRWGWIVLLLLALLPARYFGVI